MRAQDIGLLILVAVEHMVHVAFQIEQGGARLDGEDILLDAAEIAMENEADLVEKQGGEFEGEGAKEGHGLRSVKV
jgi:hypothetical protein